MNADKKRKIRDSRRLGTANLVAGLKSAAIKAEGARQRFGGGLLRRPRRRDSHRKSPPANDFLATVCREWEEAAREAEKLSIRVVNPRIGIVLGKGGGALAKMLPPFKFGLGGRLGSGRQWMPWIHVDDLVGLMLFAAEQSSLHGPANAVSPNPVTNADFTRTLAGVLHRPAILPAPAFGLKLMLGEFAGILLASQRGSSRGGAGRVPLHVFRPEAGPRSVCELTSFADPYACAVRDSGLAHWACVGSAASAVFNQRAAPRRRSRPARCSRGA